MNGANLTGATVTGTNFTNSNLTAGQLYSTSNYQAQNLQGIGLSGIYMAYWSFSGQNLTNANLTSAYLYGANLTSANLTSATMNNAALYYTALSNANLTNATLNNATIYDANLSYANLADANLTNTNLSYSILTGATVAGANFASSNLTASQLYSTADYQAQNLQGIGLAGNNLAGWSFAGQNLTNANLTGTYLYSTALTNANLTGANLSSANLTYADFTGATVAGANFASSNVTPSQLYSTASYKSQNLQGVGLSGINLSGWSLMGQNLTNANLSSTTLTNADLTGAAVTGASFANSNLTASQLYSTTSYQAQNLAGIGLSGINLTGWDLAGQNLTNANFNSSTLSNTNLAGADLRGAQGASLGSATTTNTILPDGTIQGLYLNSTNPTLVVRNYSGNTPIHVLQGMSMNPGTSLVLQLDGNPWRSTISFDSGIPVTLGGNLELGVAAGVDPTTLIGHAFQTFNWSGVTPSGQFNIVNDVSATCLFDVSQLYSTGNVGVLGHAAPSLAVSSGNNQTVIVGAAGVTAGLTLSNGTAGQASLASLDVNALGYGVNGSTGGALVVSGATQAYTASLTTGTLGPQTQTFSLNVGDDHTLVGASSPTTTSAGVNLTVLGHAGPSLSVSSGNNQTVIVGATGISAGLTLSNGTSSQTGLASLDVNSLGSGVSGSTGGALVASGATQSYTALLGTAALGHQTQTFSLNVGDDHTLPGASPPADVATGVTLTVLGHARPEPHCQQRKQPTGDHRDDRHQCRTEPVQRHVGPERAGSMDVNSLGSGVSGSTGGALVASGATQPYTATLSTATLGPSDQELLAQCG